MALSVLTHWGGRIRSRGGPDITPEIHPLIYWATVIGAALLGLAITVATLISFFRDSRCEEGDGVVMAKDPADVVKLCRQRAEEGVVNAQYQLSACYQYGHGVAEDYVQAYKWYSLASAQGDKSAENKLPVIEGKMTKEQVAESQRLAREFKPRKTPVPGGASFVEPSKP